MPIEASVCDNCKKTMVPPRSICPYCNSGSYSMNKTQLDDKGSILSYSLLKMPPNGFKSPLLLALVELEQGAIILSMAEEETLTDIKIGANVNLKKDEEGRFRFSLKK